MDGSTILSRGAEAMPAHIVGNMNGETPAEPCSLASGRTRMERRRSADAVVFSEQARARLLIDCVMEILRATLEEHDAPSASAGRLAPWQERRLKAHIEANLSISLTTAELAGLVNLSP